jgi:hypothetical protein
MAQAARPLPPTPGEAPPPQRLRAVPPPPRTRRRAPSPEVIRRRRAVALGGLAGLIGLPLAIVALGGSPPSATGQISSLLTRGASEPATLCDHLSSGLLRAVGGHAACVAASPARAPGGEVRNVRIKGLTASAIVSSNDGDELVRLVWQQGDWKVDDVR